MNIEKAKELIEKLITRTEARGATPSEAIQAAELAEKIAKRYGLDVPVGDQVDQVRSLTMTSVPHWAKILLWAVQTRFDVAICHTKCKPWIVQFEGPEHRTKVALWLFNAIRKDLDKQSYIAGRSSGKKAGKLLRFRNQFRLAAARKVARRLNPIVLSPERIAELKKQFEATAKKSTRKPRRLTKAEIDRIESDHLASQYGRFAGDNIKLDTNVLPGQDQLAIEQQGSFAKAEAGQ